MKAAEVMTARQTDLIAEARTQVDFWFDLAEELIPAFKMEWRPRVTFNLRGQTAGTASWSKRELRLNEILLRENFEHFQKRTIPHEVAHFVTHAITQGYGKSHGREWKMVMRKFGCEVSRCHSYDVTNSTVRTVVKEYRYICGCSERMYTRIRHRRSEENGGRYYRCRNCRQFSIYTPEN